MVPDLSIPFIVIYWAVMAVAVAVCGVAVYVLIGDWWRERRTAPPRLTDINARIGATATAPPIVRGPRRVQ